MDAQLQAELNRVINAISGLGPAITKEVKKELNAAAKPLLQSIRSAAPRGKKAHTRISGFERITYKPGNLKRSFRVLNLRRAKTGVYVGAKWGGAADGYYAHFVNDGTINAGNGASQNAQQFVEKGLNSVKTAVLSDSVARISRLVRKYWISSFFGKR
jgi:HK97 gp10 family phage protein